MRGRAVGGSADVSHLDGTVLVTVGPPVYGGGGVGHSGEGIGGQSPLLGGGQSPLLDGLATLFGPPSTPMNDADDDQYGRCHGNDDAKDDAKISVVVIRSTW